MADNAITLPDYFANRFHDKSHLLRIMSALVVILFFTVYTAASLVAGGKLFESSLGLSYSLGLWVTAGVVVAYTLFFWFFYGWGGCITFGVRCGSGGRIL